MNIIRFNIIKHPLIVGNYECTHTRACQFLNTFGNNTERINIKARVGFIHDCEFRFENSQSVDQDVKVAVSDADGNVTKRIQDKVDAGQSEIVGARIKVLPGTWSYRVSFGVAGTSGADDKEVTFTFEVREDGKDKRDARYIGQSSGESHECDRDYKKSNNTWKIKLGV